MHRNSNLEGFIMQFQIIKKAIFYEFNTVQAADAEGNLVPRAIPSATYKYYLLRRESMHIVILEQEHWTGEFVGFVTKPMTQKKAIEIYDQMAACGTDPSQLSDIGVDGEMYARTEATLDVLENDFGLIELSEDHLPDLELNDEDAYTTGGFRPFNPAESPKRIPSSIQQPENTDPNYPGLLGMEYKKHTISEPPRSQPVTDTVSSISLEDDTDISEGLPNAIPLPEAEEPEVPEFRNSMIHKRPPSNAFIDAMDEDEDGYEDYEG